MEYDGESWVRWRVAERVGRSGCSSHNNIDDKGYWDSGGSRHMTGNISYLSEYEPFDGGYVSFGQGGCKITSKGTIKTGKLEFENVYFVKDLKVHCVGTKFQAVDDANVLLRTPRQHNMYSIELNNIVPYKDLTCLVAKASADEEAARTMLADAKLPVTFWAEAVNTACYVQNRPQETCNSDEPESSGNFNPTATSTNPLADQLETLTVETPIPTTIMATSITEAEYVVVASGCGQVMWIQNQLLDYGEIPVLSCSSCGTLYTRACVCSIGTVKDKILVPKPPKNYARCTRCGYLVDGPHCQGCALLSQELEEILVTHSPDFQNTSEPSNASTNVVNAPREPYVVKQDNESFIDEIIFNLNKAPDLPN
nr:hypothetical protein [Tanacetum cinerariifolium]